jgi:hypothetical protein
MAGNPIHPQGMGFFPGNPQGGYVAQGGPVTAGIDQGQGHYQAKGRGYVINVKLKFLPQINYVFESRGRGGGRGGMRQQGREGGGGGLAGRDTTMGGRGRGRFPYPNNSINSGGVVLASTTIPVPVPVPVVAAINTNTENS